MIQPASSVSGHWAAQWQVDFSLALFNRSGKYQIGREILAHNAHLVAQVWYWRMTSSNTPDGLAARVIGKAENIEHGWRCARAQHRAPRQADGHRWLHLDPLSLIHRPPREGDLVVVHDLGPLTHPHLFTPGTGDRYNFAYRTLRESGATAVFVSRDSQQQFAKLFGDGLESCVIYPPVAPRLHAGKATRPQGAGDKFLLTVGAIGTRKNQLRSIEAFGQSGLASQGYQYLLCGGREPGFHAVAERACGVPGVKLLSFVSNAELRWLYRHASGFVLASQLEGFGMPVAEAMAFGLEPIISRGTVLEEVAGEAAIGVDPHDTGEIAKAMLAAVQMDGEARAARKAAMAEQIKRFSPAAFQSAWEDLLQTDRPK